MGEAGAPHIATRINSFSSLLSNLLLDAEVRSACAREAVSLPIVELSLVKFVPVRRPISAEIDRVLAAGYLRGADCLHLATALYLSPDSSELTFLTLDEKQRAVARKSGFLV